MLLERHEKDSHGDFIRHVEMQAELAEWQQDEARQWS